MYLTFNPDGGTYHWLYKTFFEKEYPDTLLLHFNYKDNRFCDEAYKRDLERIKEEDYALYQIYTQGEWAILRNKIYNNYIVEEFPENIEKKMDTIIGGLDFGYNAPTAFLKIGIKGEEVYIIDEIYSAHLTNSDLITLLKERKVDFPIYPDPAEPDRISELVSAGFDIPFRADGKVAVKKSITAGIDFIKSLKIHINASCVHTIKEIHSYKYKEDKNGMPMELPARVADHAMDAMRYAVYSFLSEGEEVVVRWL